MKKILLLIFLSFGFSFATEQIVGFLDLKWGDPIEKLGNFNITRESKNGAIAIAVKNQDNSAIGQVKFKKIEYMFIDNKMFAVYADFNGHENFQELKNFISSKYKNIKTISGRMSTIATASDDYNNTATVYIYDTRGKFSVENMNLLLKTQIKE